MPCSEGPGAGGASGSPQASPRLQATWLGLLMPTHPGSPWEGGGAVGLKWPTRPSPLGGFPWEVKETGSLSPAAAPGKAMPWPSGCRPPTNSFQPGSWLEAGEN